MYQYFDIRYIIIVLFIQKTKFYQFLNSKTMKKNFLIFTLCFLIEIFLIGQLLLTSSSNALLKDYMKLGAIILNITVFIWVSTVFREYFSTNTPIKSIFALIIVIIANLFFGIYQENYFYVNLILIGTLFQIFFKKE